MTELKASGKDESGKKSFSQPAFKKDKLEKSADELRSRWKYEEASRRPDFDEWTAAFTIGPTDLKTQALFREYNLNAHNPYHWRALLEAFVRDYLKYPGRPDEKTSEKFFRFALDVVQIYRDQSKDSHTYSSVATALQKIEPYRARYWDINPDILRKSVKDVADLIGPMDDDAVIRLAELDPVRFLDAFVERAGTTEEDLRRCD